MKSITWAGFCQSSEVNAGPCRLFSEKSCDSGVVVQSHRLILVGKFITTWSQGSGSYKVNHQEGVVTLDLISTRTFSSCKSLEIGENLIWSSILKDRDGVNVGLGLLIWTSLALLFFTHLTKPWTEMDERSHSYSHLLSRYITAVGRTSRIPYRPDFNHKHGVAKVWAGITCIKVQTTKYKIKQHHTDDFKGGAQAALMITWFGLFHQHSSTLWSDTGTGSCIFRYTKVKSNGSSQTKEEIWSWPVLVCVLLGLRYTSLIGSKTSVLCRSTRI